MGRRLVLLHPDILAVDNTRQFIRQNMVFDIFA